MKILLVDDNDSCRDSLKRFFEQYDNEVIEARDGIEGFERAAVHNPDIIISDGLMPNMDGFEFLRNIKKSKRLRHIPFIFTSAFYIGKDEKELALSLGADAFVPQPKEPKELWNKILIVMAEPRDKSELNNMGIKISEKDYLKKHNSILSKKLAWFQSRTDFDR